MKNKADLNCAPPDLMTRMFYEFDLRTIGSSMGNQVKYGEGRYLSDFATLELITFSKNEMIIEDEFWFFRLTLMDCGDFNFDGEIDFKIEMEDHIIQAHYHTLNEMIVTRKPSESNYVAINDKVIFAR